MLIDITCFDLMMMSARRPTMQNCREGQLARAPQSRRRYHH
jgi:hypothetical protein